VYWTPLGGVNEEDANKPVPDVDSEEDLIGKPWTYRLNIKQATNLPVFCQMAYVEYSFMGETFTSEVVEQTTFSPVFNYSHIHHVERVTPEFVKFLRGSMEIYVHVTQNVETPPDKIGTNNAIVVESIKSGVPKGYEQSGAPKPKSDADALNEELTKKLAAAHSENTALKKTIQELELRLAQYEGDARPKSRLNDAKLVDSIVNGQEE